MPIIAGIDEAGYGPPLGPLVVSATVFRVSDEHRDASLWKLLSSTVTMKTKVKRKLIVADSKHTYSRARGVGVLEETALCFLAQTTGSFDRADGLLQALAGKEADDARNYPWYGDQDVKIPLSGRALGLEAKAERLRKTLDASGVTFMGVRCLPLFEAAFNRAVEETDNKSIVLFSQAARLIHGMMNRFADDELLITVDKHGGRNRYGPLLGKRFRGATLVVRRQDRQVAHYRVRHRGRETDVRFMMHGEQHSLPVALASMFSKYVRELYMKLFNGYWQKHLPTLKATAGYAADAKRFLDDIAPAREKLGIPDDVLIRTR